MSTKCVTKMTAYELYAMINSRQSELSDMKSSYASAKAELDSLIAEMTYKSVSVEAARRANKLRESVDSMIREIKAIELCSRSIQGFDEYARQKTDRAHKKSFRDCVLQFLSVKGSNSFEPTEVAKFVADVRGQLLTNSVRVFTHRILKDLVLQNHIKQVAHGLYVSNQTMPTSEISISEDSVEKLKSSLEKTHEVSFA